jgi:hypothetical protein
MKRRATEQRDELAALHTRHALPPAQECHQPPTK